jgi:hypothetical protein
MANNALPAGGRLVGGGKEWSRRCYGATGHKLRVATVRASLRYDIENDIIVDAKFESLTVDERSLAKEHLQALGDMELDFGERKPIVICDCGYPSKDFIAYLQDKEIKYIMRVTKRFDSCIDKTRNGSEVTEWSEGKTRATVFRLKSGKHR